MLKKLYIIVSLLCFAPGIFAQQKSKPLQDTLKVIPDTTPQAVKAEEAIIDDIVETGSTPQRDKIQYFSQLTRYGFKNLFPKYGYNPAMPYSTQVNPNAEAYMQDYLKKHGKSLIQMKPRALPYFNLIDNILTQYGLPKELKYIAVIESNLSTAATSPVGAGGPWQFMPPTAREYGLVVNGMYDERRDYFKSTRAAARYLLTLYKQLHDWLLVMAAYNGGASRVNSAIFRSGSRNFWSLQYYLPEESRNYVKKFIATHYVMDAAGGSGFNYGSADHSYSGVGALTLKEIEGAEVQTITGKYNSVIIAKNISMEISTFNRYNPLFDNQIATNGKYELILPEDKMQLFMSEKYRILNECVQMLLGDSEVPNNTTVYPDKYKRKGKVKFK